MEPENVCILVRECRAEVHVTNTGTATDVYLVARINGAVERVVASHTDYLMAMRESFEKMIKILGVELPRALNVSSAKLLLKDDGTRRVWLQFQGSHVEEGEHPFCHVSAAFAAYCKMLHHCGVAVRFDV